MYCWSLAWKILSTTLLTCEISTIEKRFEHSPLVFFGIEIKTELFQFCGHSWVFQSCWHVECSIFTISSFRIWNSSTGIPSFSQTVHSLFSCCHCISRVCHCLSSEIFYDFLSRLFCLQFRCCRSIYTLRVIFLKHTCGHAMSRSGLKCFNGFPLLED